MTNVMPKAPSMLLCLSPLSRFPIVQAYRDSLRISFRTGHNTCSKFVPILARALSTENNLPNPETPSNPPSSSNETLSLLQRAVTILPRALNIKRNSGSTRAEEATDFWNVTLSNVYEDLSATTKRPAKIVGSCTPIVSFDQSIDYLSPSQYVA